MSNKFIDYEALHNHIVKMAQKAVREAPLQSVRTGVIKEILPNEYYIQLTDSSETTTIRAEALDKNDAYKLNDLVYLLLAPSVNGGDSQVKYFIFGLVSVTEQNFVLLSELERFQADENAIAVIPGGEIESIQEEFTLGGAGNDIIVSIKMNKCFGLSGIFTTGILTSAIEYGLKVKLFNKDKTLLREIVFNNESFIGQPFALNNSKQETVITLTEAEAKALHLMKVEAYCKGMMENSIEVKEVTVSGGSLQEFLSNLSVDVRVEGGKDYFKIGAEQGENEKISLRAIAKCRNQELSSTAIRYYWFIEDEAIDENHEAYNPILGNGWRCLNDSQEVSVAAYGGSNITKTIKLWNTLSPTIEIVDRELLTKYENKVKCVISYQFTNVESKEDVFVYNLNHEAWNAVLESNNPLNILTAPEQQIELTCKVENKNIIQEEPILLYRWFINEIEVEGVIDNLLKVKDNDGVSKDELRELQQAENKIKCVVYFNKDNTEVIVAETNEIIITSAVVKDAPQQALQHYKCFISTDSTIDYKEEQVLEEIKTLGIKVSVKDWIILQESNNSWPALRTWSVKNDYSSEEIYNQDNAIITLLENAGAIEGEYYLHATSRQVVANLIEKDGQMIPDSLISVSDWGDPILARHFYYIPASVEGQTEFNAEIRDLKFPEEIKQLNAFNRLTNNGRAQGVFYAEGNNSNNYSETLDTVCDIKKNYYYHKVKEMMPFIEGPLTAEQAEEYYFYPVEMSGDTIEYIPAEFNVEDDKYYFNYDKNYYIKDKQNADKYLLVNLIVDELKEDNYYVWDSDANRYKVWNWVEYNPSQVYYTRKLAKEFTLFTGKKFEEDTIYYEKIAGDGDLYINATFINTGTLRVGEGENEKFYASIDNPDVRIAGFQVDSHTFESQGFMGEEGNGELREDGIFVWDEDVHLTEPAEAAVPMMMSLRPTKEVEETPMLLSLAPESSESTAAADYSVNTMSLDDGVATVANNGSYTLQYEYKSTGALDYNATVVGITSISGSEITVSIPKSFDYALVATATVVAISSKFSNSSNLHKIETIVIPPSVTTIDQGAFNRCANLKSFGYYTNQGGYGNYAMNNNMLLEGHNSNWYIKSFPPLNDALTTIKLSYLNKITAHGSSGARPLTGITGDAFTNCNIQDFKISEFIIGANDADTNTYTLQSNWGDGLPTGLSLYLYPNVNISGAFPAKFTTVTCSSDHFSKLVGSPITSIAINGGTKLGSSTNTNFYYFKNLEHLEIGSTLTTLTGSECQYLTQLQTIVVDSDNTNLSSDRDVLYDKDKTVLKYYPPKQDKTVFILPESVTTIEAYAFSNCTEKNGSSLKYIVFQGTKEEWASITKGTSSIPSEITIIYAKSALAEGLSYEDNENGTCTLTGRGSCTDMVINIPSSVTIDGKKLTVTKIAEKAFENDANLYQVILPETIENIGQDAFSGCEILQLNQDEAGSKYLGSELNKYYALIDGVDMTISEIEYGTIIIAGGAFALTENIQTLIIPKTIKSFSEDAFSNSNIKGNPILIRYMGTVVEWNDIKRFNRLSSPLNQLTSLNVNDGQDELSVLNSETLEGIIQLNDYVFAGLLCNYLSIPSSITKIGTYALYTSLDFNPIEYNGEPERFQAIELSENWTHIADDTWILCANDQITSPSQKGGHYKQNTEYGYYTLTGYRTDATDIEILSSIDGQPVSHIGDNAFTFMTFSNLVLKSHITSVGKSVFEGMTETSITIYNKNISIDEDAFNGLSNSYIYFRGTEEEWNAAYSGVLPLSVQVVFDAASAGLSFEVVGAATAKLSGLGTCTDTEITIPNKVTIEDKIYQVVAIADYAFESATHITTVKIPEGVYRIGNFAFQGCASLTKVEIPASVTSVGENIFKGCTYAIMPDYKDWCYPKVNGKLIAITSVISVAGVKLTLEPNIEILADKSYAIATGYAYIEKLTLYNNIAHYGASAFENLGGNKNLHGSEHIYFIGSLFEWASATRENESSSPLYAGSSYLYIKQNEEEDYTQITKLDDKTLAGVEVIEDYAFYQINGVDNTITIPNSVKKIGTKGLYTKEPVSAIYYQGTVTEFSAIQLGSTPFNATAGCMIYCTDNNVIDANVFAYYEYNSADDSYTVIGCNSSITTLTFPFAIGSDPVKRIAAAAFKNNEKLQEVIIPISIKEIGDEAFSGCTNISNLFIKSPNLEYIGTNALSGVSSENITFCGTEEKWNTLVPVDFDKIKYQSWTTNLIYSVIEEKDENEVEWAIDGLAQGSSIEGILILPDQYEDKNLGKCGYIRAISQKAFYNQTAITGIIFESASRLEFIYQSAFAKCTGLIKLFIPNTITLLNESAFDGCSNLREIYLHDQNSINTLIVSKNTFVNTNLEILVISAKKLQANGIFVPSAIKNLYIDANFNGFTTNSANWYNSNQSLENLYIDNLDSWAQIDFSDARQNPLYYATNFMLEDNSIITEVILSEGVEKIGSYAFYNASKITKVTLPSSIKSIGKLAFCLNKTYDTQISYPLDIHISDMDAWSQIDFIDINGAPIEAANPLYVNYLRDGSESEPYIKLFVNGEELTVLNSQTVIVKPYAFEYCKSLKSVILPNVETIGEKAFLSTPISEELYIGDTLKTIGAEAFAISSKEIKHATIPVTFTGFNTVINHLVIRDYKNTDKNGDIVIASAPSLIKGLKTLEIDGPTVVNTSFGFPNGLSSNADCTLQEVILGSTIKKIRNQTFRYQKKLSLVHFNAEIIDGGIFTAYNGTTNTYTSLAEDDDSNIFDYCGESAENGLKIIIGTNVKKVPSALCSCSSNNSVSCIEFEENSQCEEIGSYAFNGCSELTEINLPDSIHTIGKYTFKKCTSLPTIKLPEKLTGIQTYTFYQCEELVEINIPDLVESIENNAFENCYALVTVKCGNSVKSIGDYAFKTCRALTTLDCGKALESIGAAAFLNCAKLKTILLPKTLKNIDTNAFNTSNIKVNYLGTLRDWCGVTFVNNNSNPACNGGSLYIYNPSNGKYELLTEINLGAGATELEKKGTRTTDVLTIKSYAFYNFDNLSKKKIVLPANCMVEESAFGAVGVQVENIYYEGTDVDWFRTNIAGYNPYLTGANTKVYTYASNAPTAAGNYWKYSRAQGIQISDGANGMFINTPYFKVDDIGRIHATDVNISGAFEATAGVIGGCEIKDGVLKIKNINISEKIKASNIEAVNATIDNAQIQSVVSNMISTKQLTFDNATGTNVELSGLLCNSQRDIYINASDDLGNDNIAIAVGYSKDEQTGAEGGKFYITRGGRVSAVDCYFWGGYIGGWRFSAANGIYADNLQVQPGSGSTQDQIFFTSKGIKYQQTINGVTKEYEILWYEFMNKLLT